MFGWTLYNPKCIPCTSCILLLILIYISVDYLNSEMINSELLPTLKSVSFAVVSRRCITSSQNVWEAVYPERNYSTLTWNLLSVSYTQLRRFIFHLMKNSKYVLKFLMHFFANNEPETTSCHPFREFYYASIAHSFKVTPTPGLSSVRLFKLDIYKRIRS